MSLRRERTVSFGPGEGPRRFGRVDQDGTAVVLAATWSREESERRPGRFLTLHHDHMGLDNYPIRCTCGKHKYQDGIPARFTHRPKDPCPLKREGEPSGIIARCCWLRGELAARELEALGNEDLPRLMRDSMSAEQAIDLSVALKTYADAQEREHRGSARKPKGAGWHGYWAKKRRAWIWTSYSTFEEALASIREAARWYEKVGRLGFGVQAWN